MKKIWFKKYQFICQYQTFFKWLSFQTCMVQWYYGVNEAMRWSDHSLVSNKMVDWLLIERGVLSPPPPPSSVTCLHKFSIGPEWDAEWGNNCKERPFSLQHLKQCPFGWHVDSPGVHGARGKKDDCICWEPEVQSLSWFHKEMVPFLIIASRWWIVSLYRLF